MTKTLTWDAPSADGGSPIDSYRVLIFEGTSLVATLEPTTPTCTVEQGSVDRTALVQAVNAQGFGVGAQVTVPAGTDTTPDPGTGGGTGGGSSGAPTAPTIAAARRSAAPTTVDVTAVSAGGSFTDYVAVVGGNSFINPFSLPGVLNGIPTETATTVLVRCFYYDTNGDLVSVDSNTVTIPAS